MFITVFSIILFNYTAGDIKVTRKLMQDTQYYNNLKSISLVATEFYRTARYQGSYYIRGRTYNFQTRRISPTKIAIQISDRFNNPMANVIVKDRSSLSEMNLFVLGSTSEQKLTFRQSTTYENFVSSGDSEIFIQASSKIFNISFISPQTVVNGKSVEILRSKEGQEYYFYYNLEEMNKYSNYASFVDPGVTNFLIGYFTNISDFVRNKSESNRTFSYEPVDLTKYGSVFITSPQIDKVNIKFNMINTRPEKNQEIVIDVYYRQGNKETYLYYLVKNPQIIRVKRNAVITNDPNISSILSSFINIDEKNVELCSQSDKLIEHYILAWSEIVEIDPGNGGGGNIGGGNNGGGNNGGGNNGGEYEEILLEPQGGFVYKVMIKLDQNGDPSSAIIYKTHYDKTIIYADTDVEIGSNSPGSFEDGRIGSTVLLITSKSANIKGHVVYNEFSDFENFIDSFQSRDFRVLVGSESYFNLVADNIKINFTSDRKLILNGDYVSFFNRNSQTSFYGNASYIYYLGSNITAKRYVSQNEKIITDPRENNPLKQYFLTFKVLAIDMKR
ncbi:MAG: hypothetical protein ACK4GJ_00895 [bacterium]